jgi:hypothetical protein
MGYPSIYWGCGKRLFRSFHRKMFGLVLASCLAPTALFALGPDETVVDAPIPKVGVDKLDVRGDGLSKGALVVPVYPRKSLRPNKTIKIEDLQDSYIVLKDGSALSMADWILGGLNKDTMGAGMSDYENRLFLGQVARAMVGADEDMVHASLVNVRPTVRYKVAPPPKGFEGAARSFASLIVGTILPGTPAGYDPAKAGGAFAPRVKSGGDAATLFENQFHNAMMHSVDDLRNSGINQDILEKARAKENGEQ